MVVLRNIVISTIALNSLVGATPIASVDTRTHVASSDNHGAVASETDVCSKIGIDIMKKEKGNAADAMIATVICVGTIGMYHSGIGGGGFMLVRSPKGQYEFIDFREKAPAAAYEDMYKNNVNASIYGGLARYVNRSLK